MKENQKKKKKAIPKAVQKPKKAKPVAEKKTPPKAKVSKIKVTSKKKAKVVPVPPVQAAPIEVRKEPLPPPKAAPVPPKAPPKPVSEKPKLEIPKPKRPAEKIQEKPPEKTAEKAPEIKTTPEAAEVHEEIHEEIVVKESAPRVLEVRLPVMLKDLAHLMGVRANAIIAHLIENGVFANINQNLGEDIVKNILPVYGFEYKKAVSPSRQFSESDRELDEKGEGAVLVPRAPVVTFMGHVDHGKTSLLDFIRKTHVADREKGGITQHIGAYRVKLKKGSVTFLDTPGHAAFTAMRARGANATDIVVLVVAADDGVMPQTKEAVDHARAAGVTIVVAMNKCDLPAANLDKVKGQLAQIGLAPEGWGGKTIAVPVSAKTGEGVEHLLEMLLLEAELLELKANPKMRARGVVIEGKLSSGQGPMATILVKNGTLSLGDMVVSGMYYGKVKAMLNDRLERVEGASPSMPVTILGLSGVPMSGDEFFVVKDEKKARTLSLLKQDEARERKLKISKRITLEDFYQRVQDVEMKELKVIIKGDVQGSVEALQKSLEQLSTKDVQLNVIHSGIGNINESDVMLAVVSNCVIIGFNVKTEPEAENTAEKEEIEIKLYGVIYEAIADVQAAMEGLLEPYSKEVFVGRAQVRQVFRVSKVGTIAGSYVVKGKIARNAIAKLIRDKKVIYEGKISGLKRFKDDAREVMENFECGIGLDRHDDIKEGDLIEVYQIEKVARRLTK